MGTDLSVWEASNSLILISVWLRPSNDAFHMCFDFFSIFDFYLNFSFLNFSPKKNLEGHIFVRCFGIIVNCEYSEYEPFSVPLNTKDAK